MSLLSKLKESDLGLKGQDIPKRDGKVETSISLDTPLSMKGKKPENTYQDVIKNMENVEATLGVDSTGS